MSRIPETWAWCLMGCQREGNLLTACITSRNYTHHHRKPSHDYRMRQRSQKSSCEAEEKQLRAENTQGKQRITPKESPVRGARLCSPRRSLRSPRRSRRLRRRSLRSFAGGLRGTSPQPLLVRGRPWRRLGGTLASGSPSFRCRACRRRGAWASRWGCGGRTRRRGRTCSS